MGLGRLNPGSGCNEDSCNTCIECDIWLEGCTVYWDCDFENITVTGKDRFGYVYFTSNDNVGSYSNPHEDSVFTISRNGSVVDTLMVGSLPVECCREGISPPYQCYLRYPDLNGISVNISGLSGDMQELNGIYVLSNSTLVYPNYYRSTRYRDPANTLTQLVRDCIGGQQRTIDIEYNYSAGCSLPFPFSLYSNVGLEVLLTHAAPGLPVNGDHCSQIVHVGFLVAGTKLDYPNRSDPFWCGFGWSALYTIQYYSVRNIIVGCNDPDGPAIEVDLSDETSLLVENFLPAFMACGDSQFGRGRCCRGGIF